MLYGISHIPQMYLLSYFFQVSATGFASLVAWNILTSKINHIAIFIKKQEVIRLKCEI